MPIIDETYFIGELNIPNTNQEDVLESMDLFIEKYEERFLIDLLGYELYKGFKAGLTVNPIADKWAAIKDGGEYTYNGRLTRWNGLKRGDSSVIANYVYYWWQRDNITVTTGTGEKKNKSENSTDASPASKMTRAWNEMVPQCWELVRYIESNLTTYPEWDRNNIYHFGSIGWQIKDIFKAINTFNL